MTMTAEQIASKTYDAYIARMAAENEADWDQASREYDELASKLANDYHMFAIITVGRKPELISL